MIRINSGLDLFDAPWENELEWGDTLVVAPHPDDESLGCGGTLARLAKRGNRVGVVWVSDGSASHPGSIKFPPPQLAKLRQIEALEALRELGLPLGCARFLGLPDGALPFAGEVGFDWALDKVTEVLREFSPQTLVLPWRRDPHRDHRATWYYFAGAARKLNWQGTALEYLVWAFERGAPDEWPQSNEARAFRVDIGEVLSRKKAAIEAHESQVTHLIDDANDGFWLSPAVLAHFERPYEIFVEPFDFSPDAGARAQPTFEL